jgi:hypothetical protein
LPWSKIIFCSNCEQFVFLRSRRIESKISEVKLNQKCSIGIKVIKIRHNLTVPIILYAIVIQQNCFVFIRNLAGISVFTKSLFILQRLNIYGYVFTAHYNQMNGTSQYFSLDASSSLYEMQHDPILVGYPSYGLMVESPLAPETSTRSSQVLESSMTMFDQDHQVITRLNV